MDPVAVQAWREAGSGDADAALRELAGRLPEMVGDALAEAFRMAPDKRNGAWIAVAAWQLVLGGIFDHLHHVPELPEPEVPEQIERLRKIANR